MPEIVHRPPHPEGSGGFLGFVTWVWVKPPGYGQVLVLGSISQGTSHFGVAPFLTTTATLATNPRKKHRA